MKKSILLAALTLLISASAAQARDICTVLADARSGKVLLQDGDCESRVTPASTFKLALAVIGFDAGVLTDAHAPVLPFKKGYADWGGDAWRQPIDPTSWMKHSVVWYSQRMAETLGRARLEDYAKRFAYGNADFSGDPGKDNGLERAWISSSLKISPLEQTAFLQRLLSGKLPIRPDVLDKTRSVVESANVGGWQVSGKTGSAYPRNADGSLNRAAGWGWYVGWAEKGDATLVFARLAQDEKRHTTSGGIRTKDALMRDWPALAARIGR
ncbi:class D beta-lactamase [Tianweitania sp. Rool2]|uniref:beta-lactamase n=2 Tax=Oryzicola mucosus TaxID=2767425 RepID=A0A8J6U7C9_9HYPH|nr:class D beta-lactamase [Oryzicola mucosus]MBD0414612.1 class D beta-lactamase [Oryzicola mucosus]